MNPFRCILLRTGAALFVGSTAMAAPATGPLRVGTANPRYFTDSSGRIESSGQAQQFKAPFEGDAVLLIWAR